jgi:hypothetical protein
MCPFQRRSATKTQLTNQRSITLDILSGEISQQLGPLAYKHEKSTAGCMVLLMYLEVLGESLDSLTEKSYLHLGAARITFLAGEMFGDCRTRHLGYFHSS